MRNDGRKKTNKCDPRGEDKKEKQHKNSGLWIYEMYFFRLETQKFLE